MLYQFLQNGVVHHKTLRGQGEGVVLPDGVAVGDALAHKGALGGGKLPAAGGAFIMQKKRRTDNIATLDVVGRDQPD